jgi:diguanylate cyclase (GGDEF)-like protein
VHTVEQRRIKKNGVLLATSGLLLMLLVALVLRLIGLAQLSLRHWLVVTAATLLVQATIWLIPHRGWDRYLGWDPHYIYLPMLMAALQLNVYITLVPQARYLVLLVWFVASLFMAGLAGFREVVMLSAVMAAGYLAVLNQLIVHRVPLSLTFEHMFTLAFVVSSLYAGVVFERLRRDRSEMQVLRRRLGEMAHTDPLTGLSNRRQFESVLQSELAAVRRYGGQCAMAMIDVDFFKQYNDAHGHVAGDVLLKTLADVMRAQVRATDLLTRYGGEEFGLIMSRTAKPEALRTVERLRAVVEAYGFKDEHTQPGGRLTISAGLAVAPDDGVDFDAIVRRSDDALYAAKRNGRNRVESAEIR